VTRVSLNIDAWNAERPRRLRVGDVLVRVGWFHTLDAATITLESGGHDRKIFLVIPFDCDSATAGKLIDHLSAADHWPDSASDALHANAADAPSRSGTG
jgi:hypothetical protein